MRKTILLLLLALGLSAMILRAQSLDVRYYFNELASSTVYTMMQDHRGFLWLGTAGGITCFDGVSSKHYGFEEGLENEFVIALTQTRDSTFFVGTWGGGVYRFANGVFSRYTTFDQLLPRKIKFLKYDHNDRLWVGDALGIGYIYRNRYTVVNLGLKASEIIYALHERRNGDILFATSRGLFTVTHGKVRRMCNVPEMDRPLYSITEEPDGTIWCGSNGTLYEITHDTHIHIHQNVLPTKERISVVQYDSRGNLWAVGVQSGICIYDRGKRRTFSTLRQLARTQINTMYEDTEHNVWMGTYGLGAVMVAGFRHVSYTTDDNISNSYILDICGNGTDSIIIGTRDGATVVTPDTVHHIALPLPDEIPFAYVPDVEYDTAGTLWMIAGTSIVQYHKNGRMTRIDTIGGLSRLLYIDHLGRMWLYRQGVEGNQLRYENQKQILIWNAIPALATRRVLALAHDRTGIFWIATDSGVFSWRNGVYKHYTTSNGLPSNQVHAIAENRDGIWFATSRGLACMYNGRWKYYTEKDGLSSNKCHTLLVDKSGTLWIGTQNGLNHFVNSTFVVYDKQDGLISDEIHALYLNNDSTLWIGTNNGVTKFYIQTSEAHHPALPLYITGVTAFDSPITENENLPYNRNSIQFEFIGLAYRSPDNVVYRYRMVGIDNQWQHTNQRSLHYSSLPAGQYTFQVQARNKSGAWSKIATFSFSIQPALWETWWFRSIGFISIGALLVWIAQWQAHRTKIKELEQLAVQYRILQLEQQALQALMNPHFIFNALNSIHRYIRTNEEEQASDYLAKFASLIRMTFESTRSTCVVLEEELQRLELYLSLEQLRFGTKLTYRVEIDPAIDVTDIRVPSMILQPYVENAILHGIMPLEESGHITIEIQQNETNLIVVVEDNGIGIKTSQANRQHHPTEHRSSGMLLTEERLRLLSRLASMDIVLTISEKPIDANGRRGTRVEIIIPINLADTIA